MSSESRNSEADAGGGRKERKKNELLIKLINKSIIITSFSFSPEDIPIIEDFKKIVRREAGARSFSRVLVKAIGEYNKRHCEGNPQLKIASYLPDAKKSPMRVLCWSGLAGATSDGKIYCRKQGGLWIQGIRCYSCPNNQLRKKKEQT